MKLPKLEWTPKHAFIQKLSYRKFIAFYSLAYSVVTPAVYLVLLKIFDVNPSTETKVVTIILLMVYSIIWAHGMWETKKK